MKYIALFAGILLICGCGVFTKPASDSVGIEQITFAEKNYSLGLFDAWSPNDEWVVFGHGPNETNDTIGKVNVLTGEVVTLYHIENQQPYGPGCGTPSYCRSEDKVIFIHGPTHCSERQKYEFWRRSGVAIEEPRLNEPVFIDARDVTFPFTPGASRGGTHCHEWSGDGRFVAFTYNDMIMAKISQTLDLRTIGVSADIGGVTVDKDANNENFDGRFFTVLLVEVVPNPKPGSDEISRAYENCWVGLDGYKTADGKRQRAIAFKGKTIDAAGNEVPEVYIVNIPDDITKPGAGPLEGTMTNMPYPPAGAEVIRLTRTADCKYPGLSTDPRFWLRTSPEGDKIFYLARDYDGINQVYYVRILDKTITQVTHHAFNVDGTVNVSPDGGRICYIADGSVFVTSVAGGKSLRLTEKSQTLPSNPIWSNRGDKIVFNRAVTNAEGRKNSQIFVINGMK